MSERVFRYRGVKAGGEVADLVRANDPREAIQRLSRDGVVVTDLKEQSSAGSLRRQKVDTATRILIMRQLGLLTRAGVDLLEALDTTGSGLGGEAEERLQAVATSLRRGDALAKACREHLPGFPNYVYALINVGEASGKLPRVLEDAAQQLAFEDKIRRDVLSALSYPTFLVCAGFGAVGFLFYEVVPRFAEMIGDNRANLTGLAALVIEAGVGFRANAIIILAGLALLAAWAVSLGTTPAGRQRLYKSAHALPVVGSLLLAQERTVWARIMGFALGSGLGLLEAAELAATAAPAGSFHNGLINAARQVRAGKKLDEAFAEPGLLARMDLSLLRTGQRTGALGDMFGFIAERHEQNLRDALKRLTGLIEPLAIGIVAVAVGAVAIGLVTAMSSVYDTVM